MKQVLKIFLLILILVSCQEEPVETVFPDVDTGNGVFIACEGNFMYGNGTLSFYDPQNQKVINQIFYARNNAPLGDVVQSLALRNNTLFVVINNSGKVYAVDPETIELKGVIRGLVSPRYIHFLSDEKAYISDLYAHHISIINPMTYEITGKIDIGEHTSERMLQKGNSVFVTDWSYGRHILIIDSNTDQLVHKIEVPFQPKELVEDTFGKIWVLCTWGPGSEEEEQPAALCRIDPETFTLERIFRFAEGLHPAGLQINPSGDTLYYISGGIFKMPVNAAVLPAAEFIPAEDHLFYSLAVNPFNNELYVSDAIDYTQDAIIYRYLQTGELIDSFKAGINPSDFLFRQTSIP